MIMVGNLKTRSKEREKVCAYPAPIIAAWNTRRCIHGNTTSLLHNARDRTHHNQWTLLNTYSPLIHKGTLLTTSYKRCTQICENRHMLKDHKFFTQYCEDSRQEKVLPQPQIAQHPHSGYDSIKSAAPLYEYNTNATMSKLYRCAADGWQDQVPDRRSWMLRPSWQSHDMWTTGKVQNPRYPATIPTTDLMLKVDLKLKCLQKKLANHLVQSSHWTFLVCQLACAYLIMHKHDIKAW